MPRSVALLRLGCARNDVDAEEIAGRLEAAGWAVTEEADGADAVVVNTCGFIAAAKQDSIDTLLAAHDTGRPVVAVGCLAERYGAELAAELPEAAAVLSFDDYPDIAARLDDVIAGRPLPDPHVPRDRRTLLPVTPVHRPEAAATVGIPGHVAPWRTARDTGQQVVRRRLGDSPVAPLKLASGCDRRCSFCAIPAFRGRFVSRPPDEVLAEAEWLAARGVRELFLVSENTTSYGKDFGDLRALEKLLPQLSAVTGVARVRLSYLQPAEMRPSLLEAVAATPGVASYFDLSFQHASRTVLRAMRRFGEREQFLDLLRTIRESDPEAGARSNVIVGFPGETEADFCELTRFLEDARLDAVGVFGYSDEDGTAAAELAGKHSDATVERRVGTVARLVDELMTQRAEERVGGTVRVLVEQVDRDGAEGRAEHQGPEADGTTRIEGSIHATIGDVVTARVTAADGADLIAVPV